MPVKAPRVQQKRAKLAKSFCGPQFLPLAATKERSPFIATRGFIHQTSIERNPSVASFNDFAEPKVDVEDAFLIMQKRSHPPLVFERDEEQYYDHLPHSF
jgi:hypothetical protein